ncbi:hypothetical protein [Acinetobacter junii]|uniref:hypothetical protein n=1 Tax=Acinetobacter junii TaxID=40215 RepID=UPI003A860A99
MQLNFEKKMISNEEFLALDSDFRGFFNEFNKWELAHNPVVCWVDAINNIRLYFSGWLTGPEDPRPFVYVCLVQWQEKFFRFYFNLFYIPEFDKFYGDIRDTCWTVFKVELVKGWDNVLFEDIEEAKEKIIQIADVIKSAGKENFLGKAEVKFVNFRFETRPVKLLGE